MFELCYLFLLILIKHFTGVKHSNVVSHTCGMCPTRRNISHTFIFIPKEFSKTFPNLLLDNKFLIDMQLGNEPFKRFSIMFKQNCHLHNFGLKIFFIERHNCFHRIDCVKHLCLLGTSFLTVNMYIFSKRILLLVNIIEFGSCNCHKNFLV